MTRAAALSFGTVVLIVERGRNKALLVEKQLAAEYATLLSTEAITGKAPGLVKEMCPTAGWLQ